MFSPDISADLNIPQLFKEQSQRLRSRPMVFSRTRHHWRPLTWEQMLERVECTARGLLGRGLQAGERAGLMAESCIEWVIADQACAAIGMATVAIPTNYADDEIDFILSDSKPRIIFVTKADALTDERLARFASAGIELVVTLQNRASASQIDAPVDCIGLVALENEGAQLEVDLDEHRNRIDAEDLLTIIYTSGTTGQPKGVMLSHRNVISNCEAASRAIAVGPDDVLLSFLPLGHSFERLAGYYLPSLFAGAKIYYSSGLHRLLDDIQEVRPTIITGVPRLLERMLANIISKNRVRALPLRLILNASIRLSPRIKRFERSDTRWVRAFGRGHRHWLRRVLTPVRRLLGDRLRFVVTGGAALGREAAEFFYAAGVLVLEGYGLTEASPIVSVNRPDDYAFGSVGRPLDNVRVRLAEDGEILVKGPNVMLGYWGGAEGGSARIDDGGWLHTGDVGFIDRDGFLSITSRKKDLFKDSSGRYIAPTKIENLLQQSPEIQYAVVFGDDRPFPVALIFTDPQFVPTGEARQVELLLAKIVARTNRRLSKSERIRRFEFFMEPLTTDDGLLTPTLKPRRSNIYHQYSQAVEGMYAGKSLFSPGVSSDSVAHSDGTE